MANPNCTWEELVAGRLFRVRRAEESQPTKEYALVFVHGFGGDAKQTWKSAGATESFPSLIATDPKLPYHEVFVFQYATKNLFPPAIENIANQLGFAVKNHIGHPTIIFLAHSMGGLVCMTYILKLLKDGDAAAQKVGGLLLYGTPMGGIEWIEYAQLALRLGQFTGLPLSLLNGLVKTNRQVRDLTAGGVFIDRLNGDWARHVLNGGHQDVSVQQRAWIPTRVVSGNDDWVVRESSARGLYSKIDWINVDADHRALVKPDSRLDETYQAARDFLLGCSPWPSRRLLPKLRRQLNDLANLQASGSVSKWHFEVEFEAETCEGSDPEFGIPGFRTFRVSRCSYESTMTQRHIEIGFAMGTIAAEAMRGPSIAFLHSIRLDALCPEQAQSLRSRIERAAEGAAARWNRLFKDVRVEARPLGGDDRYRLSEGDIETVNDGLVRRFTVPSEAGELLNREVEVSISFRSLIPEEITDYTVEFPWLCDGFRACLTVAGSPCFLAPSSAMRGPTKLGVKREPPRKIEYSSQDLILPGSYIRFEWGFEEQEAP